MTRHPLVHRLRAPLTLVLGKGGVGKSTTAAGLALALGETGAPIHLLSTDPAHSLMDILGDERGGSGSDSAGTGIHYPCGERLAVEELDGEALARNRLAAMAPGLEELVDHGTYLDRDDAASLVEGAVPGLDEIGAALRIAELSRSAVRLVVDTAPTGHTLRLLGMPRVLRGWVQVFRAMADKAGTVAAALVGGPVRMAAESALDELLDDMEAFELAIEGADLVVVTGRGTVIEAETRRLLSALDRRGLRVTATATTETGADAADIVLPRRERGPRGCEELRQWWAGAEERATDARTEPRNGAIAPAQPAARRTPEPEGATRLPEELDRELVVFAGKGGVGKTTCAAAAAVLLAEAGRGPVLLLGADPAGSIHDVLPDPPQGLEIRELEADRALDDLKRAYREEVEGVFGDLGLDRSARLDREIVEALWDLAPPGIDELIAVSRVAGERHEGGYIIMDPAPTGHFLRLVAMPEVALDWTHRIMRILLKYRALGGLDAPAEQLLRFARRFRELRQRLTDPSRTAIVLVTLDQPVVAAETARLLERLRAGGIEPSAAIVNRATRGVGTTLPRPVLTAPAVPEPVGAAALSRFGHAWQRVRP